MRVSAEVLFSTRLLAIILLLTIITRSILFIDANLPGWRSVYSDYWCTYLSGNDGIRARRTSLQFSLIKFSLTMSLFFAHNVAQMHEIGHNIALHHSGDPYATNNAFTYGDQSGMMGYSYSQDNGPIMCFNGPKSWQLGWYDDKAIELDPLITPNGQWSGRLHGIANYSPTISNNVLVKLETGNDLDYYINFNRKTGINSGTVEGGNQVLITEQGGNGVSKSESKQLAKLSNGGTYIIDDFGGSSLAVTISVTSIDTAANPGYADITISRGTAAPTASPTPFSCTTDADCISFRDSEFFACPYYTSCDTNTNTCVESCNCDGSCDDVLGETANSCPSDCADKTSLLTTVAQNNGSQGNMWSLVAKKDVIIQRFDAHLTTSGVNVPAKVFTKLGGYAGSETNPADWMLIQTATVTGQGSGTLTELPLLDNPIFVPAGTTQSFYVQSDGGIRYTDGNTEGNVFASDANIDFLEGVGKSGEFGSTFRPRIWNGRIVYVVVPDGTPPPVEAPSSLPSEVPSTMPSNRPSMLPSLEPSLTPSSSLAPSNVPSNEPSSIPSITPPSSGPSLEPSVEPSGQPTLSSVPSKEPSSIPSLSSAPSEEPSSLPSVSNVPSVEPSNQPSLSSAPSITPPSNEPSFVPSTEPSGEPSLSSAPSEQGSNQPSESSAPSEMPSDAPSSQPSLEPSSKPSVKSSSVPSNEPSSTPSTTPPSSDPSDAPSKEPSSQPSASLAPSTNPSSEPSFSAAPSEEPSSTPSSQPTPAPTPASTPNPTPTPTLAPPPNPTPGPTPLPTPAPAAFSCSSLTPQGGGACKRTSGCRWKKGRCIDGN